MLLQARDGHGHVIGQPPLLELAQLPQAQQISHAIPSRDVFLFEPSTLRATHR
jgi:hypothetical protein